MSIEKICKKNVVTIDAKAGIAEAARLMRDHHVGDLIVLDHDNYKGAPAGIITDRDIVVSAVAQQVDLTKLTVSDVMSHNPVMIRSDSGIYEAIQAMQSAGVNRLPVVGTDGKLFGVVTAGDLLELLTNELHELVSLGRRQRDREEQTRPTGRVDLPLI